MKNKLFKCYLMLTFLLFNLAVVAQTAPGDDTADGTLEGNDTPLPLNEKIFILMVAGILFAYYTFRKYRTPQQE